MDMETLHNQSPEHKELFNEIQSLCLSFPGTSERLSHGAPTYFVNDKQSFVQYRVNHHGDERIALWCAAAEGVQALLIESSPEAYFRPPYVGHLGWIGVRLDGELSWEAISSVIGDAYLHRAPKKFKELVLERGQTN